MSKTTVFQSTEEALLPSFDNATKWTAFVGRSPLLAMITIQPSTNEGFYWHEAMLLKEQVQEVGERPMSPEGLLLWLSQVLKFSHKDEIKWCREPVGPAATSPFSFPPTRFDRDEPL